MCHKYCLKDPKVKWMDSTLSRPKEGELYHLVGEERRWGVGLDGSTIPGHLGDVPVLPSQWGDHHPTKEGEHDRDMA